MVTVTPIPSQPSQGWADTDWTLHTGSGHNTSIRENGVSIGGHLPILLFTIGCLHSCHAGSDPAAGALCWALLGSAGLLSLYTAIYCHYNALLHHYNYHLTIIITTPHMYFIFPIHSLTSDQPGKQPKISRN